MSNENKYPGIGKSLLSFPRDFVVVDLETTGISSEYDEIIEISCIKVQDLAPVDSFSTLVQPEYEIPQYITDLTGITQDMLNSAPVIREVLPAVKDFILDAIVVGHNIVGFDSKFLCNSFSDIHQVFSNDYVDTLRLSRRMFPEMKHHRLIDMAEKFNIPADVFHRSSADCGTTFSLYKKLYEIASASGDIEEYLKQFSRSKKSENYKRSLESLTAESGVEIDPDNYFYEKKCVITGKLEKYTRKDAAQILLNLGAEFTDDFKQDIDFLIVSESDYKIKDKPTGKILKAQKAILKGHDITIIPESMFYELACEDV